MFKSPSAPSGAPNILLVMIGDAGFGASSTFGGPAHTPVLSRLANKGLRFNRFHTTALCSPTRAALLTGHNHHSAATGVIMEMGTGFPGYTHLGFDYFYAFNGGEADQWYPTLYEHLNPVQPWETPTQGYNLGADQTDKAIAWLNNQKSIAPDRPFFLYYVPGGTHAPHHPPKKWAAKYKSKFAHGYNKQREISFARQKVLGVIPDDAKLTPRMEQLPSWNSHNAQAKDASARPFQADTAWIPLTSAWTSMLRSSGEESTRPPISSPARSTT